MIKIQNEIEKPLIVNQGFFYLCSYDLRCLVGKPYVAERYVIWNNMRTFYFALDYSLTLLGIFTSLMVVFYASIDNAKNYIIFLSLMSLCCTIANIFANSKSLSLMAQRVWRELDMCIAKISMDSSLPKEEKNKMLMEKIIELEKSIENYEH